MLPISPTNNKKIADAIFAHWSLHGDFEASVKNVLGDNTLKQGACEHIIKNAVSAGRVKDVVRLLDALEHVPNINLHSLHNICLARHTHSQNPSVDMSVLLLSRLMIHMIQSKNPVTVKNSKELSSLLSGRRTVDHMIETVVSVNEMFPGAASLLRAVILQSSLHEKEGVCYTKWKNADSLHKLFGTFAPEEWATWSPDEKEKYKEKDRISHAKDLLYQMNILLERYQGKKDKATPPPIFAAWWSHLSENDRATLVPLKTTIPWQTHPIAKWIAPYVTCAHLSFYLKKINAFDQGSVDPHANYWERIDIKNDVVRCMRVILKLNPALIENAPIGDLNECRALLMQASIFENVREGHGIRSEMLSLMDRRVLSHGVEEALAGRPKAPRAVSKL